MKATLIERLIQKNVVNVTYCCVLDDWVTSQKR